MHDPFMSPQTLRDFLLLLLISVGLDIMKSFCKLSCMHISSVQKALKLTLYFFPPSKSFVSVHAKLNFSGEEGLKPQ